MRVASPVAAMVDKPVSRSRPPVILVKVARAEVGVVLPKAVIPAGVF
jgi:hypothetical protein